MAHEHTAPPGSALTAGNTHDELANTLDVASCESFCIAVGLWIASNDDSAIHDTDAVARRHAMFGNWSGG